MTVRAGVKRRLVEIFAHAVPEVRVAYTWDGKPVSASTLWLGQAEGDVEPESIGRRDPLETDTWTIPCRLDLLGQTSPEVAEERVEEILNRLDAVFRTHHRLTGIDGLDDGDTASYRGVTSVRIRELDGPGHTLPDAQTRTITGWADWVLVCAATID